MKFSAKAKNTEQNPAITNNNKNNNNQCNGEMTSQCSKELITPVQQTTALCGVRWELDPCTANHNTLWSSLGAEPPVQQTTAHCGVRWELNPQYSNRSLPATQRALTADHSLGVIAITAVEIWQINRSNQDTGLGQKLPPSKKPIWPPCLVVMNTDSS